MSESTVSIISEEWKKQIIEATRKELKELDQQLKAAKAELVEADSVNRTRQERRAAVAMRLAAFADGQDMPDADYIRLRAESDLLDVRTSQSERAYRAAHDKAWELEKRRGHLIRGAKMSASQAVKEAARVQVQDLYRALSEL